jgi:hypothetical protein
VSSMNVSEGVAVTASGGARELYVERMQMGSHVTLDTATCRFVQYRAIRAAPASWMRGQTQPSGIVR